MASMICGHDMSDLDSGPTPSKGIQCRACRGRVRQLAEAEQRGLQIWEWYARLAQAWNALDALATGLRLDLAEAQQQRDEAQFLHGDAESRETETIRALNAAEQRAEQAEAAAEAVYVKMWEDKLQQAEAQRDALRAYAQHRLGCPISVGGSRDAAYERQYCKCGLAALASLPAAQEVRRE